MKPIYKTQYPSTGLKSTTNYVLPNRKGQFDLITGSFGYGLRYGECSFNGQPWLSESLNEFLQPTILFSSTFPAEVELLASQSFTNPQPISMDISKPAVTVTHALYPVPSHLKSALLLKLLKQIDIDSVLVFTRTKHRADKVARQIAHAGHRVTSLHDNRTQGQRERALHGFKTGHFHIMVATDIAARFLEMEDITHVINYDMPATADAYMHRIGRKGHAQRTGDAFTLVTPEDNDMIRALELILGGPIKRETLADFDYSLPAPPRFGHERREGNRLPSSDQHSYAKNRLASRRRK